MGLAASILVIDVPGYTKWTKPGKVYGENVISSYVLASMLIPVFNSDIFGGYALNELWMDSMKFVQISLKVYGFFVSNLPSSATT